MFGFSAAAPLLSDADFLHEEIKIMEVTSKQETTTQDLLQNDSHNFIFKIKNILQLFKTANVGSVSTHVSMLKLLSACLG
jgi:hypothetical protein